MERRKGARITEPKYDAGRNRWHFYAYAADGSRAHFTAPTERAAWKDYDDAVRSLADTAGRTISEAIEEYERHLTTRNKPRTAQTTIERLNGFFRNQEISIGGITPEQGKKIYAAAVAAGYAVDTHRNMLGQAKTFMRWCVAQGWIKASPLEGVKGEGMRSSGKPQPRIDEARRWYERAIRMAKRGEEGAAAALMTLVFGMRASEVVSRAVRDLDDNGRLLWIPDSKTRAGRRTLEVPDELRPILQRFSRGKAPEHFILGDGTEARSRHYVRRWVKRICAAVGIPEVTAHGMRGMHSTMAVEAGATAHLIVKQMGHTSFAVTETHYIAPGTLQGVRQRKVLGIIEGGRRGPKRAPEEPTTDVEKKVR